MDVRCERCRTEYEFDDEKITESGVTVRCTVCGHVFKVKKKALLVTVPVKPGEEASSPPGAPDLPPSSAEKQREWKVRQPSGNVFTFKELTTLQKWIVERKVCRDDEISLTGESWKRLGNIAELASFFQVVEAADRANALAALAQQGLQAAAATAQPPAAGMPIPLCPQAPALDPPPTSAPVAEPAPSEAAPEAEPIPEAGAPTAAAPSVAPVAEAAAPADPAPSIAPVAEAEAPAAPAPVDLAAEKPSAEPLAVPDQLSSSFSDELDPAEIAAIRGSGTGKRILLGLLAVAVIGGGIWVARRSGLIGGSGEPSARESQAAVSPSAPTAPPALPEAAAPLDAGAPELAAAVADAGLQPQADAGLEAAAAADAGAPLAAAQDAGQPAPTASHETATATATAAPRPAKSEGAIPEGKDFYWYIERAHAQRERGRLEQAMALYDKAAELEPDNFEVLSGKGFCQIDKGNFDAAIALFQAALKQNARFMDAVIGLAESYREKGNKQKALEYYKRYLDEAPSGPEANLARTSIERLSGE